MPPLANGPWCREKGTTEKDSMLNTGSEENPKVFSKTFQIVHKVQ